MAMQSAGNGQGTAINRPWTSEQPCLCTVMKEWDVASTPTPITPPSHILDRARYSLCRFLALLAVLCRAPIQEIVQSVCQRCCSHRRVVAEGILANAHIPERRTLL